jgi:hypothetical protein
MRPSSQHLDPFPPHGPASRPLTTTPHRFRNLGQTGHGLKGARTSPFDPDRTFAEHAGFTIIPQRAILPLGQSLSRNLGEIAMKALSLLVVGLAVAILSTSASKADYTCSFSSGGISPVPCAKRYAVNYDACRKYVIEHGATSAEAMWWCTSQGYTK